MALDTYLVSRKVIWVRKSPPVKKSILAYSLPVMRQVEFLGSGIWQSCFSFSIKRSTLSLKHLEIKVIVLISCFYRDLNSYFLSKVAIKYFNCPYNTDVAIAHQFKQTLICNTAIPFLGMFLCKNSQANFIHNNAKLKTVQISINSRINCSIVLE